jgi:hypothetical protein
MEETAKNSSRWQDLVLNTLSGSINDQSEKSIRKWNSKRRYYLLILQPPALLPISRAGTAENRQFAKFVSPMVRTK